MGWATFLGNGGASHTEPRPKKPTLQGPAACKPEHDCQLALLWTGRPRARPSSPA